MLGALSLFVDGADGGRGGLGRAVGAEEAVIFFGVLLRAAKFHLSPSGRAEFLGFLPVRLP